MKKALAGYLCFVAFLGAFFAGGFYVRWANLDADLRAAGALLAEGQALQVRELLRPHHQSRLRLDELRKAGLWADLLESAPVSNRATDTLLSAEPSPFPEALILLQLLRRGSFETVAGLVSNASPQVRGRFSVFERVARLELGDTSFLGDLDHKVRTELAARIEEVQSLRSQGADQILRDRSGRLLGWIAVDGEFQPTPPAQDLGLRLWLPRVIAGYEQLPGLRLTLDLELTRAAQQLLGRGRGSIVVLDSTTGAVLAATSDRRTLAREGAAFFDQALEPASIAKLITTSAALRARIDVDDAIRSQRCGGSVEVEDGRLYCPVVAGRLKGLDEAMAISCNTTFARLGAKVGNELLLDELRMFGFNTNPGAVGAVSKLRSSINTRRKLAEVSIGLNHSQLTPLHAARIAAVFANGGQLLEPHWIWAEDGYLGRSPRKAQLDTRHQQATSLSSAIRLRQTMLAVTSYGTMGGIAPSHFPVAMKTGTASEPGRGFHVNYIGVGPTPDFRYAFAIRLTDHRTSKRVRQAARGVTHRFLRELAKYDGRRATSPPTASEPLRATAMSGL